MIKWIMSVLGLGPSSCPPAVEVKPQEAEEPRAARYYTARACVLYCPGWTTYGDQRVNDLLDDEEVARVIAAEPAAIEKKNAQIYQRLGIDDQLAREIAQMERKPIPGYSQGCQCTGTLKGVAAEARWEFYYSHGVHGCASSLTLDGHEVIGEEKDTLINLIRSVVSAIEDGEESVGRLREMAASRREGERKRVEAEQSAAAASALVAKITQTSGG